MTALVAPALAGGCPEGKVIEYFEKPFAFRDLSGSVVDRVDAGDDPSEITGFVERCDRKTVVVFHKRLRINVVAPRDAVELGRPLGIGASSPRTNGFKGGAAGAPGGFEGPQRR